MSRPPNRAKNIFGTIWRDQARFTGGCGAELGAWVIAFEWLRVVMGCILYVAGLLSFMRVNRARSGKVLRIGEGQNWLGALDTGLNHGRSQQIARGKVSEFIRHASGILEIVWRRDSRRLPKSNSETC